MPRNMVWRRRDAYLIVVSSSEPPTELEWGGYLRDVESWSPEIAGILIYSEGGGPNGAQRRRMREVQSREQRLSIRTAVVCNSLLVRGIVKAIGLFNPRIQAFRLDALRDAIAYIGAVLSMDEILAELEQQRRRLN
jgi:hypothetical protein